jgi:hypothetical protein
VRECVREEMRIAKESGSLWERRWEWRTSEGVWKRGDASGEGVKEFVGEEM